jgi:membrane protein YdbS with pleckstrin-like domain
MNRVIFFIWFLPLIFMGIAFYVLVNSNAPVAAKIIFFVVPLLTWMLGGIAIYREYREKVKEERKEEEILEEAKRILSKKNHHEERQG